MWSLTKFRGVGKNVVLQASLCVVPKICSPLAGQTVELAQATYEHVIEHDLADGNDGCGQLTTDVLIGADFYWDFASGRLW